VRSAGNRLALEAAVTVINAPGARYNPLFVHGDHGTGKSHLAHAIGNALLARSGGRWTVACVSGEAFVEELITALHDGTMERWRARYRSADVLIVDDVHALDDKERTQEELFHLFNALQQSGRQIVFTSDRPLARLTGLQARLRSRLGGGLVVEMGAAPGIDRAGRLTPVPDGAEAAAPNIDAAIEESLSSMDDTPVADIGDLTGPRPSLDSFFFDSEKVVAEWPDIDGRVLEELR
jgi:chromosomal replication initiator protein